VAIWLLVVRRLVDLGLWVPAGSGQVCPYGHWLRLWVPVGWAGVYLDLDRL